MRRILRASICLSFVCVTFCGGSPTSPGGQPPSSPPAPTPTPTLTWALSGTVSDAVTGAPISGATLSFANQPVMTTSGDGGWTLSGTGTAATRQALTISAPGYIDRDT